MILIAIPNFIIAEFGSFTVFPHFSVLFIYRANFSEPRDCLGNVRRDDLPVAVKMRAEGIGDLFLGSFTFQTFRDGGKGFVALYQAVKARFCRRNDNRLTIKIMMDKVFI